MRVSPNRHLARPAAYKSDHRDEAEDVGSTDYEIEALKKRCRRRPAMGSGPADVVPVRIDPEPRAAIEARAQSEDTTTTEVIREVIRKFLEVA